MSDAVGDDLDGQTFGIADGLIASLAIAKNARQFQGFGDPASIRFPVQLYGQLHIFMLAPEVARTANPTRF